jgi:hypothetical protein
LEGRERKKKLMTPRFLDFPTEMLTTIGELGIYVSQEYKLTLSPVWLL